MVKIYQFVGTFEFYEISNYIWILYGIFLFVYYKCDGIFIL